LPLLYFDLIILGIASSIGPGQIIFDTLLLLSPNQAVSKASSFVAGMTAVRLFQGIVFGLILEGAIFSISKSRNPTAISSTLLLVVGIILLINAYKQWQNEPGTDGAPPKWMAIIDRLSPVKSFGVGIVLVATSPNLWFFTLNAIAVISEAQLNRLHASIAFLIFVLVAELLVLSPIVYRLLAPQKAGKILDSLVKWLIRNNRLVMIAFSLLFGLYFMGRAITQLLG
jgi:hypothetical protein